MAIVGTYPGECPQADHQGGVIRTRTFSYGSLSNLAIADGLGVRPEKIAEALYRTALSASNLVKPVLFCDSFRAKTERVVLAAANLIVTASIDSYKERAKGFERRPTRSDRSLSFGTGQFSSPIG